MGVNPTVALNSYVNFIWPLTKHISYTTETEKLTLVEMNALPMKVKKKKTTDSSHIQCFSGSEE